MSDLTGQTASVLERLAAQHLSRYGQEYNADHLTWRDFLTDAAADLVLVAGWIDEVLPREISAAEVASRIRKQVDRG